MALWPTEEGRKRAVRAYHSCREEKAHHLEWEDAWQAPRSESVRRMVAEAFALARNSRSRTAAPSWPLIR
ncbi:hypothetical protein [Streptomyces aureocirculatus]|uniref:hypothetical protein n=1 Tax=Streptomyces aureocirculatus TaxID=67275 RepID=UPI0004CA6E30|nr:hypothetical protein [Streptomyces aureocirculatus]